MIQMGISFVCMETQLALCVHIYKSLFIVLNDQQKEFNTPMSSIRTYVEWLFGDVINYFKFMDFKTNLKVRLSPTWKMYVVCAILQNAHTIM